MRFVALFTLFVFVSGTPGFAEGIDGVWQSEPRPNGGYITVEIGPCAEAPEQRCGIIVGAKTNRRESIVGRRLLSGLQRESDAVWVDGLIRRPTGTGTYRSNLSVEGDQLRVEGCAVGGLFCQSQHWHRVQ
ncbi:MAG: DUF2147 domain-containing protein [Pseudomonadota bacterium]